MGCKVYMEGDRLVCKYNGQTIIDQSIGVRTSAISVIEPLVALGGMRNRPSDAELNDARNYIIRTVRNFQHDSPNRMNYEGDGS